ncbi:hypothetical protein [Polymorphospora rubra]|uniref:hypothetical protein n=1 Tax=Polymorphospora rubra TaxID=338584 RepID=UPI0033D399E9
MTTRPGEESLVAFARARLAAGDDAPAVFLELVSGEAAPPDAAIAVCVAAGSSRADAESRLEQFEGLWEIFEPGEEGDAAYLLAVGGYFEPDAVLGEDEQEAVAQLNAVLTTVSGIPSGFAAGYLRDLRTGRLVEAFLRLERLGTIRWADNPRFWAAMCRAGRTFPDGHADLDAARQRCYERVTAS